MATLTTNLTRLWRLLSPSHRDIYLVAVYTVFIGIFFLAVPLSAQGLVGSLASGIYNQPILVLGSGVFIGVLLAGLLRMFQLQLLELVQQKVFVHAAMDISKQLLAVNELSFQQRYAPEVMNRFFDVITIQKTLAKLLLDGPASLLQIVMGMLLISFYSPWFLLFNVVFSVGIIVILALGIGGYTSSVKESTQKYRIAQWLEEMGQSRISFKMNGSPATLLDKTNQLLNLYLDARQKHFKVVIRQSLANFTLEAIATTGVLVVGGYLVMNGQLTLGQLVASEIVILVILSATDKLVQYLESFYDLMTGVEKIHAVLELPQERTDGGGLPIPDGGLRIECRSVLFGYTDKCTVIERLDVLLPAGSHTSIVGASGVGKSTLASLLCGLYQPNAGEILINGIDIRQFQLKEIRKAIALVGDGHELFEGTVEDNILLGISQQDLPKGSLQWAVNTVMMTRDLAQYPLGLNHPVTTAGTNLSLGQRHRILMARALVQQPRFLILDEAFTGMDEYTKLAILENLFSPQNPWTILNISHDAQIVQRTDTVYVMDNGRFIEAGDPVSLSRQHNSAFSSLFPDLSSRLGERQN